MGVTIYIIQRPAGALSYLRFGKTGRPQGSRSSGTSAGALPAAGVSSLPEDTSARSS